jgi:cytoskeletal protein RodZ
MSRVVSKKLREAREARNLTLEQVASATHIRMRYLQAMESGNFNALPSQLQIKGFIRAYGGYLGLNPESLIEALDLDPWTALETLSEEFESQKSAAAAAEVDSGTSFKQIGRQLQSQRDILGLTLEDVAQHTHLRVRYLKALEAGDIEALPSPVQGRGMLKNYAVFLGLDADDLLLEFAEGLQARLVESAPEREIAPVHPKTRSPRSERRFLSRDLVIGILLGLFMVLFIVWGAIQVTNLRAAEEVEPTAPSIVDVLNPSATPSQIPTPTPTILSSLNDTTEGGTVSERPGAEQTQEVIFLSESSEGPVQVQIVAQQRAWMRIVVDGDVEFDGRILPGSIYGFAGEELVEITTGNGAGLQVLYNGQDLGTLGNFGQVINFVITVDGVQTPTPTITLSPMPTATETPEITSTPE